MSKFKCLLEIKSRVSGKLWNFGDDKNRAKNFEKQGVGGIVKELGDSLLEISCLESDKIVGGDFSINNRAVVWTDRGYIYLLHFAANVYYLVGKPGLINCCRFVTNSTSKIVVGLKTKRVLVIDVDNGSIESRHVEDREIIEVDTSPDGEIVSILTSEYVALCRPAGAQVLPRLKFSSDKRINFVKFLSNTDSDNYRLLTASTNGDVAIWTLTADFSDKHVKPTSQLLSTISLGKPCDKYFVCPKNNSLYAAVSASKLISVNLDTNQKVEIKIGFSETLSSFSVITISTKTFFILSSPSQTSFLNSDYQTIYQNSDCGQNLFSLDGFLMLNIKLNGKVDVIRSDQIWTMKVVDQNKRNTAQNIQSQSLPPTSSVEESNKSSDRREPITIASRKPTNPRMIRAERDYDQILSQLTPRNLSPVLQLGSLSYPTNSRATIWTKLLNLPRNKKLYLKLCHRHNSEEKDIINNVLHWSPQLKLVPHIRSLLTPFLTIFSGHNTTSFEFCVSLLSRYTWVSHYPAPSPALVTAWRILVQEAPDLVSQLTSLGVTSRHLLWPLLQTCWASTLPHSDWLQVWDHIVTSGPGLVLASLVSTVLQLQTTLRSCDSPRMVHNLMSSHVALNVTRLLSMAHDILEKHLALIDPIVNHETCFLIKDKYPISITLEDENIKVLKSVNPNIDYDTRDRESSSTRTEKCSEYHDNIVKEALSISPPPVPRLRTNARGNNIDLDDKENDGPLAPLKPIYNYDEAGDIIEDEWSDINDLLKKAKVLRQVLEARK